jgi:hypothetical protein
MTTLIIDGLNRDVLKKRSIYFLVAVFVKARKPRRDRRGKNPCEIDHRAELMVMPPGAQS